MVKNSLHKLLSLALVGLVVLSGCSGGGDAGADGKSKGKLRFMNAIPELANVALYLDDDTEPTLLHYGQITEYTSFKEGEVEARLFVPSSLLPLLGKRLSVTSDTDNTIVFMGEKKLKVVDEKYKIQTVILVDKHEPEIDNRFLLQVVNGAPSPEAIDVFVDVPGVPGDNLTPWKPNISFGSGSKYLAGNEAKGVVRLRDNKSKKTIYQSGVIDFGAHPVVSLFVLDQLGRGLPVNATISYDSDL